MWIRPIVLMLLLLLSSESMASQDKAQLYAFCGREQNDCQSQCVHVELVAQPQTMSTDGPPKCSAKNNRIARCRNQCYVEYIRCRGGK